MACMSEAVPETTGESQALTPDRSQHNVYIFHITRWYNKPAQELVMKLHVSPRPDTVPDPERISAAASTNVKITMFKPSETRHTSLANHHINSAQHGCCLQACSSRVCSLPSPSLLVERIPQRTESGKA